MIFEIAFLLIISFILRVPFLLSHEDDSSVYSWMVVKERNAKIGDHKAYKAIPSGFIAAPSLFHRILSFLPDKYVFAVARISVLLFDVFNAVIIYIFLQIEKDAFPDILNTSRFSSAFLISLIFTSTPIFFPYTARLKSIGARTLGTLLSSIFFLLVGYMWTAHNFEVYILLSLASILIVMSSQFSMQSIILTSFFLGFVSLDFSLFGFTISSILIGALIPFTGIRRYFQFSKINHWLWYFRNYKKSNVVNARNRLKDIFSLPFDLFHSPSKAIDTVFKNSTLIILLHSLPLVVVFFYTLFQVELKATETWLGYFYMLSISALIVFFLTSLKPLLFLGEAERYLEPIVLPITVIGLSFLSKKGFSLPDLVLMLFSYNMTMIFISFIVEKWMSIKQALRSNLNLEIQNVVNFVNSNFLNSRVLCIPTKHSFIISSQDETNSLFYLPFVGQKFLDPFSYMEEDMETFYLPKDNLLSLQEKYGFTHFIFERKFVENYHSLDNLDIKKVFSSNRFVVYEIERHRTEVL